MVVVVVVVVVVVEEVGGEAERRFLRAGMGTEGALEASDDAMTEEGLEGIWGREAALRVPFLGFLSEILVNLEFISWILRAMVSESSVWSMSTSPRRLSIPPNSATESLMVLLRKAEVSPNPRYPPRTSSSSDSISESTSESDPESEGGDPRAPMYEDPKLDPGREDGLRILTGVPVPLGRPVLSLYPPLVDDAFSFRLAASATEVVVDCVVVVAVEVVAVDEVEEDFCASTSAKSKTRTEPMRWR